MKLLHQPADPYARDIEDTDTRDDRRDRTWLLCFFTLVSVIAFSHYYRAGAILLSGDAVAHINIARRVFDSLTPGPQQLGSVWLPLPHLLMMPFVVNNWMWRTGVGGSMPSMISFVIACWGIFRILRRVGDRSAAWIGALIFGLNPNLLFVQSTALNEPLYLAASIWSLYWLLMFHASLHPGRAPEWQRTLRNLVIALSAAILTRYDGWILAPVALLVVLITIHRRRAKMRAEVPEEWRIAVSVVVKTMVLVALMPSLWFAYNYGIYGNALEFSNGPYSARAIAQRTQGTQHHPGYHNIRTAFQYTLKAAEINMAAGMQQKMLLALTIAGAVLALVRRSAILLLLLWVPLLFYSYSVAYQDVPIFMPVWWPFSYYNLRYGLQQLPAFAVFLPLAAQWLPKRMRMGANTGLLILVGLSYASVWRSRPVCLREVVANGSARFEFEAHLAQRLKSLPEDSQLTMEIGSHVGALQMAGIPLHRALNETNYLLWQQELAAPGSRTTYFIAIDHDGVAKAVMEKGVPFTLIERVSTSSDEASIYLCSRQRRFVKGALRVP